MNQSRLDEAASTSAQGGVLGSLKPLHRLKAPPVFWMLFRVFFVLLCINVCHTKSSGLLPFWNLN